MAKRKMAKQKMAKQKMAKQKTTTQKVIQQKMKPEPLSDQRLGGKLSALEGRLLKHIADVEARLLKLERFTPAKELYAHEIKEIDDDENAERSR